MTARKAPAMPVSNAAISHEASSAQGGESSSGDGVRGEQPSRRGLEVVLVGEMKRVERDGAVLVGELDLQVPVARANASFVRKERACMVE